MEPVPGMKTTVRDDVGGLIFEFPPRRSRYAMIFLPVWLAGWAAGEIFGAQTLLRGGDSSSFMLIWLCAWTVGGIFATFAWLWMLTGKERVILKPDALVHRYELFGIGRSREYELSHVRSLRVSPEPSDSLGGGWKRNSIYFGGGVVAFDYGAKTVRFASSVDEAEGKMIVDRILRRYPFAGDDR